MIMIMYNNMIKIFNYITYKKKNIKLYNKEYNIIVLPSKSFYFKY